MIEHNVLSRCELVALGAGEVAETVRRCAAEGWVGGLMYDAIHIRCALEIDCDKLYTLNLKHFQELAPAELHAAILVP
jgi:hypothetical protein